VADNSMMNSDAFLQYLTQQGANNAAEQNIAKKTAMLQQLRQKTEMPGMIQGGGARTVKAAHPLSMLADVGGQLVGAYKQRGLDEQSNNLAGDRRSQLAEMAEQQRLAKAYAAIGKDSQGNPLQPAVQPQVPGGAGVPAYVE
jgi:hypothetical protein